MATVLACLPYLILKVVWVLGWSVGTQDQGFTGTTRVANVITGGLQLVAVGIAVLFVHPLGQRLPAVVVALPAWVGTGLLSPVALGVVLGAPLQLVTGGGNPFSSDGTLDGWVFGMVYGGFILQAVLLPAGFVLYARQRWPEVLTGGRAFDRAGPTKQLQDVLGLVFVLGAAGFVAQQLVWTVTGGGGYADPDTAQRVFLVAGALLAAGGGVAYVGLIRGSRLTPPRLVLAWLGTAVTFTSSFSETLKSVAIQRGAWGATAAGPGDTAITMLVLLSAVAGAIGGALRLRDEHRCARDPTRTAHGH